MAQYTGGNGSGSANAGANVKHLTNWFQNPGNWSVAGNWLDVSVPAVTEEANIAEAAILDASYVYPALSVSLGASVTIPAATDLTITESVINNGGMAGIVVEDGGSLIQPTAGVPATMERFLSNADWTLGQDGWHLLSSPVENQLLINGGFLTVPYDFYAWDETTNFWLNQKVIGNNITAFIPGNGYLVSYDNGGTKTFAGDLNVNNITFANMSLTGSSYYIGFHLLGNPYSSALKWDDGHWALSNVSGVASVWGDIAQNYLPVSGPNGIIPANQGFFVQVGNETNSITIPAEARTHSTTLFYKETPADFLKFRISNSANETYDETLVRLKADATDGYDIAWDGHKLNCSDIAPQLYTVIQPGENAAVNTYATTAVPASIEMGFRPGVDATYTLRVADFTFDRQIVLEDRPEGATMVLSAGTTYSFKGGQGDAEARFVLHFSPLGVDNQPSPSDRYNIYSSAGEIYINAGFQSKATYEVCGINGSVILRGQTIGSGLTIIAADNLAAGIYLIRLTDETGTFTWKVVL